MEKDKLFLMVKPDSGDYVGKILFHEVETSNEYSYGHKSLLVVDPSAIETLNRDEVIKTSEKDFSG